MNIIGQVNLIRNLKDDLMKVIVNPCKNNIIEFKPDLIWESADEQNKIKKIEDTIIKSPNHLSGIIWTIKPYSIETYFKYINKKLT